MGLLKYFEDCSVVAFYEPSFVDGTMSNNEGFVNIRADRRYTNADIDKWIFEDTYLREPIRKAREFVSKYIVGKHRRSIRFQ